jgi:thiol-disulfide isomerase/thioredoxin
MLDMTALLILSRMALVVVFLLSSAFKFADLRGFRRTLTNFGVPEAGLALLAWFIAITELSIATGLLAAHSAGIAAMAAIGLLTVFMIAIALNMAAGKRPDCHCFGQLHSKPIGWPTLTRNSIFVGMATVVALKRQDPSVAAAAWSLVALSVQGAILAGVYASLLLIGFGAWLLVQMLAQQGRVLARLDALDVTASGAGLAPSERGIERPRLPSRRRAPDFLVHDLEGAPRRLHDLLARGRPTLIAFTDPACVPCSALLPHIGRWQREEESVDLIVLSSGTMDLNRLKAAEHGLKDVFLQADREVAIAYGATATPAMVFVAPDGMINGAPIMGQPAIMQKMEHLLESHRASRQPGAEAPGTVGIGDEAPPFTLPNLDGQIVSLKDFRDTSVLMVFWNPECGFCNRMLPDLKAWAARQPAQAPRLLVVSRGSVEINRAMDLGSSVVLEDGYITGNAYGISGTPAAVLIDHDGRVASVVAAGATAILALANNERTRSSASLSRER